MPRKQSEDSFSEEEALRRFEAALRGGLSTAATPLKELPRKRAKKVKGRKRLKSKS
jgi:hypothetical protein